MTDFTKIDLPPRSPHPDRAAWEQAVAEATGSTPDKLVVGRPRRASTSRRCTARRT